MNTINNPLILKWKAESGPSRYVVNKPGEQAGEYVDKALADEMLEALEWALPRINLESDSYEIEAELDAKFQSINKLISKAKGQ
jgi:hypothetical protein